MNIINNYYKPGESTNMKQFPLAVKAEFAPSVPQGFVSGNYFPWNAQWTKDNYSAIEYKGSGKYGSTTRQNFELFTELVPESEKPKTHTPQQAYELVLHFAGASKVRDAVDERIIRGVIDGSNRLIDSQDEVGGWPELDPGVPILDTDRDGMPDYWEILHGLDPYDPADRNGDFTGDGYTNLEKYLNELAQPSVALFRPKDLNAKIDQNNIVLSWTPGSGTETGFVVERDDESGFRVAAITKGNTNSFYDKIPSSGTYTYRVKAINKCCSSFYSDEVRVLL